MDIWQGLLFRREGGRQCAVVKGNNWIVDWELSGAHIALGYAVGLVAAGSCPGALLPRVGRRWFTIASWTQCHICCYWGGWQGVTMVH